MLYSIENDRLRVEINDIGAELYSIKDKADGFEYLWQGDPQYWSGRAYNLFPICGRITEGRYTYKGGSVFIIPMQRTEDIFATRLRFTDLGTCMPGRFL